MNALSIILMSQLLLHYKGLWNILLGECIHLIYSTSHSFYFSYQMYSFLIKSRLILSGIL